MVQWAQTIGPHTAQLFERMMADKPHPEMGYRGCLGIIRLAGKYSHARMEAAAERALLTGACRYRSIESILKNSLDQQPLPSSSAAAAAATAISRQHPRRGVLRVRRANMLQEPMMEKLLAMRLHGMADALKTQEQDPGARELSFLERLALLVDHQWNWRQNQALARRLHGGQTARQCLRRRDRLPRGARTGQERDPRAGAGVGMGAQSRTHFRSRADRCGQKLRRLRTGAEGLPRWILGAVHRAAALFRDLAMARADGSLRLLLAKLSRIDVLVIDDWAMAPLSEPERRDFWEICEDRYQTRSMILTSQLPVARWHEQIGDPTVADGILDRLVHNAHRIEMRGDSMRKKRGDAAGELTPAGSLQC